MTKKQKGFSLIELLIVVAIILIIAAIAIPNLLRARIAANQSSAAASLRTLSSSAVMYQSTYQDGYPGSLAVMGPNAAGAANCDHAGLIDNVLANATAAASAKSGYFFTFTPGTAAVNPIPAGCGAAGFNDGYAVAAAPASANTGTAFYCVDTSNVIVQSNTAITPAAAGGTIACGGGTAIGN